MKINNLIAAATFSPTSLQYPNAWIGHIPFASWLIKSIEPEMFVELGTHSGNSYFSFCQAVSEANLSTKCYAIDSWEGDEHAGYYGDQIFGQVNAHNLEYYAEFSRLLRMTFDDATNCFANGSIDLLHIDGYHTYEAVKHDFEAWLLKLAPGAVVLFHDTNVREGGFGVWKLWEELQAQYPLNIEFTHSHGLGVLQLANGSVEKQLPWLSPGVTEQKILKNYFSTLGIRQIERFEFRDLRDAIIEKNGQIAALNQIMAERNEQITGLNQVVGEREGQIAGLNEAVAERDEQIIRLNQAVTERDGQVARLNQAVAERDGQIAMLTQTVTGRDGQIEDFMSSRSWRLTTPLRQLGAKCRSGIRAFRRLEKFTLTLRPHVVGALKDHKWGSRNAKKAFRILRTEGVHGLKLALTQKRQSSFGYDEWVHRFGTLSETDRNEIRCHINAFGSMPLISVLMPVYNTPEIWLRKAIDSVRAQLYPNWELCLADDASTMPHVHRILREYEEKDSRIRIVWRERNGHISASSNSALELVKGDFIAMLDHDDEISEHALYLVAEKLNNNPELDFLYSDQDKIDKNGVRYDPYFKPDYNLDLLRSQNYVDHLAVFRTSIVRDLGGWRSEFDGSQDYDFVLRFIERTTPQRICHIPYVTYHWRAVSGSIASDVSEKNYAPIRSRNALAEHLDRIGVAAKVTSNYPNYSIHRVIYPLPENIPLVSLIIPTKDGLGYLSRCVHGVLYETNYKNIELIIVNNRSEKKETYEYLNSLDIDDRVKVIEYDHEFNYSKINNYAVSKAKGTIIAFLNNDVEIINPDWLTEMVSQSVRPEIGAVGAKLYYPDDTIQHAGVFLGYRGRAGHIYRYSSRHWMGNWARAVLAQNLTAVTAACMVLRLEVFEEVSGFDEQRMTITFNDVDICLRIQEKGYLNLYTPHAELYHLESKTRGTLAFQSEEDYFCKKWNSIIPCDPFYNPNLTIDSEDLAPAFPPRLHHPWSRKSTIAPKEPLVTIITRTHGERQDFLNESLKSVFQQTYRPIQIVVVEDGSNNSRFVMELSPPEGITIDYEHLPKKGRCFAGNRGQELARGELVGFLDDDDLFLPDHVQILVDHLNANPSAAGAYSCAFEVPTDVISLKPLEYKESGRRLLGEDFSLRALWDYNYIPIQAVLFRRELYAKFGGFDEDLDCLEDWDLWLRYTAINSFVYVNKSTSLFRMPSDNKVLLKRKEQHHRYLPLIRSRQKKLIQEYAGTPYFDRLKTAFDAIA
jgi:glycosyltransferase involved in cell wall biosynthesis